MRDSAFDRPLPFEAEIAIARRHRQARNLCRLHAGSVHIELLVAETIGPTSRPLHQFGTHDFAVELVRSDPVADMDDAVVEPGGYRHSASLSSASTARVRVPRSVSSGSRAYRAASCRGRAQSRPSPGPSR